MSYSYPSRQLFYSVGSKSQTKPPSSFHSSHPVFKTNMLANMDRTQFRSHPKPPAPFHDECNSPHQESLPVLSHPKRETPCLTNTIETQHYVRLGRTDYARVLLRQPPLMNSMPIRSSGTLNTK